ncbi:plasmid replication, integration and excision activator [Nocardioides cavernaquae]|uniref:Plasmid replication, integration and excision activator n=1 Tax=Nocardioides cavernaquae TaxID=2321396 RepID=A0A3A5HBG9_9ACTN|nr:plasmid replication, integration and excision activator [Nocardioides cavernaquae]RJS47451.1 plasmid replication, integration and excision activator [Nocardioides cavernaquae]
MAVQRRINVRHGDVFSHGAYILDAFEPVADFDAPARPDGSKAQAVDKENGLPVWQINVIDADPYAGKKEKTVSVKVAAKVQPVPPENKSGTPFTLVEFSGLTLTAWIDDSNKERPKLQWSIRASGIHAPGQARSGGSDSKAAA